MYIGHVLGVVDSLLWLPRYAGDDGCSLHDRRFISEAGRTRYFTRSARRGEEKNKAPVRNPLFLLFHQCSTVHQVDDQADWWISTTWWWRMWSRWVNKNSGLEFGRSDRKCSRKFSQYRLFKGLTVEMYRSTATEERRVPLLCIISALQFSSWKPRVREMQFRNSL